MEKKRIPVFLSADDGYAPFIATTIASICDHTQSFCDFYVLDGGISVEHKKKILGMLKVFSNFSLEFLSVDAENIFLNFANNLHYSKTMFSRFFIPQLKPELHKVLYSDVDVIFLDDIQKMYDEDIEGYVIGAVVESWLNKKEQDEMRQYLHLKPEHQIFASGNLIIDCDKWRQKDITGQLFDINSKRARADLWVDQSLLNMCFNSNFKVLPSKYCYTIQHDVCFGKNKDIVVCHYNGSIKPWHIREEIQTEMLPYVNEFWRYVKMTPFYEEIKNRLPSSEKQTELLYELQKWRLTIKLKYRGIL